MLLLKMSFCAAPGVPHSANSSEFRRQKSNSVSILLKKKEEKQEDQLCWSSLVDTFCLTSHPPPVVRLQIAGMGRLSQHKMVTNLFNL